MVKQPDFLCVSIGVNVLWTEQINVDRLGLWQGLEIHPQHHVVLPFFFFIVFCFCSSFPELLFYA